MKFRLKVFYKL
jgi:elongation factor 1-alpha